LIKLALELIARCSIVLIGIGVANNKSAELLAC